MAGLLVIGQIIADDTAHMEVVRQLEIEYRVVDLTRPHLFYILLRPHLIGILMIVWYASAEHYRFEVQFLTQLLTVDIHSAAQAQSSVVGMNKHLNAIENVSFRIMCVERLVAVTCAYV